MFKRTLIASFFFSFTFCSQAAIELTADQSQSFVPYEKVTMKGRFSSISAQVDAANKLADKKGAHAFYVENALEESNGQYKVIVGLYHKDAKTMNPEDNRITYKGIKSISRSEYEVLEPFDYIELEGTFTNSLQINEKLADLAKEKGAVAYFVIQENDVNKSGTRKYIRALVYKEDAQRNERRSYDLIPADSEAAKKAISEGKPELVEMPKATNHSSNIKFWEGDSSAPEKRYTVTLSDGTKIQEVNRSTASKMESFKSIEVKGRFRTSTDISDAVAKKAVQEGAKYYRITLEKDGNGSNKIIYADLFK